MRRRLPAALTVATLVLTACGGGSGDDSADSTAAPVTTGDAPTTLAQTTTSTEATDSTEAAATTEPGAPAVVAPLTGLPLSDELLALRPALAVKIDNHPEARPQAGLNQADVVYEEIVEGITRFFAIFQSTDAAPVGPIRSARTTDVNLLNQLNRPFLVWSGGNAKVVAAISNANAISKAHGQAPGFYRDAERRKRTAVEHTLFNEGTATIYTQIDPSQGAPSPMFTYGTPTAGDPVAKVTLKMNSVPVEWTWNDGDKVFQRSEYGDPHVDAADQRIAAQNVVVQFIDYKASSADPKSPEAITVGNGDALVYTNGTVILAKWDRPDPAKPATFTAADGKPIVLTAGRTWIELAEADVTKVTTT